MIYCASIKLTLVIHEGSRRCAWSAFLISPRARVIDMKVLQTPFAGLLTGSMVDAPNAIECLIL